MDGDGIPYRTYPGTHPEKGSYFTRGTTRNAYAQYSEAGPDYLYNVHRLLQKFESAKQIVPAPKRVQASANGAPTKFGVIYYGSTSPAMNEAFDALKAQGHAIDGMRICAFPFNADVERFIAEHDAVFVVEQNRDAQLRTLLVNELEIDPARLPKILHYDGTPITARFITGAIVKAIEQRVNSSTSKQANQAAKAGSAA